MRNIAIFLFDYSLLGGVQKVTCNLVKLFFDYGLPISTVISIEKKDHVIYEYPRNVKIEVLGGVYPNIDSHLYTVLKTNAITDVIVQIEDISLCHRLMKVIASTGCSVFPILHNSPYYWIKKYGRLKEYIISPRFLVQYLKMEVYWHRLHIKLFRDIIEKHGIICVSEKARVEMCDILRMDYSTEKIKYIYNPLSFPIESVNRQNQKKNQLVYAGRLSREKQPMEMLKLWESVAPLYPEWKFLILGDGLYYHKMENYIRSHKLERVYLLGKVSNVEEILEESKISLLMSYYEGLPTSLLEASFYKNACLVIENDGGTSDIVVDGYNGFVVNRKNKALLCEKLIELMGNEVLCSRMGENSFSNCRKFSNEEIIQSWNILLKK